MTKSILMSAGLLMAGVMAYGQNFTPAAPANLQADVYGTSVTLHWNHGNVGEVISGTGFEGDTFMPEGWTIKKTYSYNPNVPGNWEHWKNGNANGTPYTHSGNCSALLRASGDGGDDDASWMQDEWIIMKPGTGAVYFDFWYYIHPGVLDFYEAPWDVEEKDHYYVKISRDEGKTWRIIWDGRFDIDNQVAMRQASIFLGEPTDERTLVAFNGVSRDTFKYMWAVDDIEFITAGTMTAEAPSMRSSSGDPDITYRIYLDGKLIKENLKCRYFTDSSEKSMTMHEYKVVAYNKATDTEYAASTLKVNMGDDLEFPAPENVEASNESDPDYDDYWYVIVEWDDPKGDRRPDYYVVTMNGSEIATLKYNNPLRYNSTRFMHKGAYKMGVTAFYSSPAGSSETVYGYTFPGTVATPRNLKAEIAGSNVNLEWKNAESSENLFYRLYRGNALIGDNLSELHFTDENVPEGNYIYSVHAVYDDGTVSQPEIVELSTGTPAAVESIEEDFNDGHLPCNWERILNDDGELSVMYSYGWRFDNWFGWKFSGATGLEGEFASINGEESGWFRLDAYLITPEIIIPDNHYPTISFNKGYDDDTVLKSAFKLLVSDDNGENWQDVADLSSEGPHPDGEVKYNLTDYEGKNVKFGWYFNSYMNGHAAVDNVKVEATQLSGVESAIAEPSSEFEVYNMSGVLIKSGADTEYLDSLAPGIYILKGNKGDVKKLVK